MRGIGKFNRQAAESAKIFDWEHLAFFAFWRFVLPLCAQHSRVVVKIPFPRSSASSAPHSPFAFRLLFT